MLNVVYIFVYIHSNAQDRGMNVLFLCPSIIKKESHLRLLKPRNDFITHQVLKACDFSNKGGGVHRSPLLNLSTDEDSCQ